MSTNTNTNTNTPIVVNWGTWESFVRPYHFMTCECDTRKTFRLEVDMLRYNKDGSLSSHLTWKNVRDAMKESVHFDMYEYDPFNTRFIISDEVVEVIGREIAEKLVTFFFVRRWGKPKKHKKA